MEQKFLEYLKEEGIEIITDSPLEFKCNIHNDEFGTAKGNIAVRLLKKHEEQFINEQIRKGELTVGKDDYLLVEWSGNWADEMDLSSFSVMRGEEWNNTVEMLKKQEDEFEKYIGTNEELRYDNGEELLSEFTVSKITKEDYDSVIKLFGGRHDEAGIFDFDYFGEDEEYYDDDENPEDDDVERPVKEYNSLTDEADFIKLLKNGWSVVEFKETETEIEICHFRHEDGSEFNGVNLSWEIAELY